MEVEVVLFLMACWSELPADGQSGNEGNLFPPVCTVSERVDANADEIAADFTFTPSEITAASEGVWTGWYDVDETDANTLAEGRLEIRFADTAAPELVTSRLVGTIEGPDGEHIDIDEPSPDCPPRYEWRASGLFSGNEGALDETIALTVSATPAFAANIQDLLVFGSLSLADLQGTARPTWDTTDWTATKLELHATVDEVDAMYGTTAWFSSGPIDDSSANEKRENYGGFSLTRQP